MKLLNTDHDRYVAARLRSRFRMGAGIGAMLPPHPGIVPIYDYGTDSELEVDYILTELLQGETLRDSLNRLGPVPVREATRILRDTASALAVAHRLGVVHCDVKPGNIFLAEEASEGPRRVRITDFGVAKRVLYDPDITADPEGSQPYTLRYAAPELIRQEESFSYPVDVFGLGMVGFEMLTNKLPYGDKDRELILRRASMPVPSLRDHNPVVSRPIERVISRSLEIDPEERYPNAREFLQALDIACSDNRREEESSLIINPVPQTPADDVIPATSASKLRVFLCHASEDKASVRQLYRWLQSRGVHPWLDEEELLPGQDWELEIRRAVRTADLILVCLSRRSVTKSGFVQKEIKFALDIADQQAEGGVLLVPLRLEECVVPERLRQWQWLDFWTERAHDRLLKTIEHRRRLRASK